MEQILLSVVITYYNKGNELLSRLLKQIEQENIESLEVILIDDCSDSNMKPNINGYNLDIKLLTNEENKGCGYSIDKGIANAIGKWITVIDADDEIFKNSLRRAVNFIETSDKDFYGILTDNYEIISADQSIYHKVFPMPSMHGLFFRNNFIKSQGINTLGLRFDYDIYFSSAYACAMHSEGHSFTTIDGLTMYKWHTDIEGSITNTSSFIDVIKDRNTALKAFLSFANINRDYAFNMTCQTILVTYYYYNLLKYYCNYDEDTLATFDLVKNTKDKFAVSSEEIYNHIYSFSNYHKLVLYNYVHNIVKKNYELPEECDKFNTIKAEPLLEWLKSQKSSDELKQEQTNNIELVLAEMFKNQLLSNNI